MKIFKKYSNAVNFMVNSLQKESVNSETIAKVKTCAYQLSFMFYFIGMPIQESYILIGANMVKSFNTIEKARDMALVLGAKYIYMIRESKKSICVQLYELL